MIHTPGWVHLGVGTLSMKDDNIVLVTEIVDTVVEAEAAACSLKVNGDTDDNHRELLEC